MENKNRPLIPYDSLRRMRSLVQRDAMEELTHMLEDHGVDAKDSDGRTALMHASFFGKDELVASLIEQGADVNHQDKIGYCALHHCSLEMRTGAALLLLNNHADPNLMDEHDNGPLWVALMNSKGNFDLVKLLIEHGADPEIENLYERTPEDLAETLYKKELDELLED
ncbi:ankyrin repeat domain-containing protein [Nonlabens ponticola]|uniref:Ankyrin repeat domain-containing protein n=1 Tax=Nonlabens ponticola TaxID=2496866 RepID=A0A3S9MV18_9FLAO|nr:ankyrin repeat domain-containing protein [Nonlabens ponticola]AZQ43017.1 ankyrin repeat domain-containing protein [Nonlabens ponticola]